MKSKELTVTLFIGDKPIETLTTEQRERMAERLSQAMSRYYTANPTEYNQLQKG